MTALMEVWKHQNSIVACFIKKSGAKKKKKNQMQK